MTPTITEHDVRAVFDALGMSIDPLVVDRIVELHATTGEIREAVEVSGAPERDPRPSSERVAEIRALLAELLEQRRSVSPA